MFYLQMTFQPLGSNYWDIKIKVDFELLSFTE